MRPGRVPQSLPTSGDDIRSVTFRMARYARLTPRCPSCQRVGRYAEGITSADREEQGLDRGWTALRSRGRRYRAPVRGGGDGIDPGSGLEGQVVLSARPGVPEQHGKGASTPVARARAG